MIFKCEACDDYKGGDGTDVCLKCTKYKHVGRENFKLELEYYADYEQFPSPQTFESLYPVSRKRDVWDLINRLEWREATMLTQYYFLEMTFSDIGEYHHVSLQRVEQIIKKSIEKIGKL